MTDAIEEFEKQPGEAYPRAFNFYNKLPPLPVGLYLVSGVIDAYNETDAVVASATVLESTAMTIDGTFAKYRVRAGTHGKDYLLSATVTLNDGSTLNEEVRMKVRERPTP